MTTPFASPARRRSRCAGSSARSARRGRPRVSPSRRDAFREVLALGGRPDRRESLPGGRAGDLHGDLKTPGPIEYNVEPCVSRQESPIRRITCAGGGRRVCAASGGCRSPRCCCSCCSRSRSRSCTPARPGRSRAGSRSTASTSAGSPRPRRRSRSSAARAAVLAKPVSFVAGGRTFELKASDIGLQPDWAASIASARRAGDGFGPLRGLPPAEAPGLRRRRRREGDLRPGGAERDARADRASGSTGRTARRPSSCTGCRPAIVPARAGSVLDRDAAGQTIVAALASLTPRTPGRAADEGRRAAR